VELYETSPFGKRYEILEKIGHGGMGNVYKVCDTLTGSHLALKILRRRHTESDLSGLSDFSRGEAGILGFKNEFRIMSEFRHPNIVKVFDFAISSKNIPMILMEFVPGKTLSELPDLSVPEIADMLIQLCHVLAYIHSRLYVHRDLKPDNIKRLDDGSVRLLDYGLMSQLGIQASAKILGTYSYMAPEVITGGVIDESTDLYSLGVIGYELLTGQRPFTGTRKEILLGHLKQTPAEPAGIRHDIPIDLNALIMKLLEKDKDRRYRNCAEVAEDLYHITEKTGQRIFFNLGTELRQSYLYSSKLAGRAAEIARFSHCLNELKSGKSVSLFIGSPEGMGKTRLLHEMKTMAALEGIQEWKSEIGDWKSEKEAADTLAGHLSAFTRESPAIWFIDDLHRRDMKQLQILNDLIRKKEKFNMLTVAGFRNDETEKTSPLWHTIEEELSEYMQLAPLSQHQVVELIENLLYPSAVSEEFAAYCFRNSGGNVFDLIELLRYMIGEGHLTRSGTYFNRQWSEPVNLNALPLPAKIEERLHLRMSRVSEKAMELARAAAVLGDDLDLESWQSVSGYEESLLFSAGDELMRHQMMIKTDRGYQFAHDKIRTVLYACLTDAQKSEYHRKAGEFLEKKISSLSEPRISASGHSFIKIRSASHGSDSDKKLVARIARHFAEAPDPEKAVRYALLAAEAAEQNHAEWEAFEHYRTAVHFLETAGNPPLKGGRGDVSPSRHPPAPPSRGDFGLETVANPPLKGGMGDVSATPYPIYEKAAQLSSAAWIDAATCLRWLQKAIDFYTENRNLKKVFSLSLSYLVSACISGNYRAARDKLPEIIETCNVREDTLSWAVLYGAGVCLGDWYQGFQKDCFDHACTAIEIFEKQLDTLVAEMWSAYSWALLWREKARAYLGGPVEMANVEKIRQLMLQGKSDMTVYWHTLTAVTARAAFTGRWSDLLEWKQTAACLSREMGKIYWFECWISHSYLYAALQHGEFSQLENHIGKVQASPDPYQLRLSWLFRGILCLTQANYTQAAENLEKFLQLEETGGPDNSYPEGFIYLARACFGSGNIDKASEYIEKGSKLTQSGVYENPLYQMQFLQLKAEMNMIKGNYTAAEPCLNRSLHLAQSSDNPVQEGFIEKLRGRLYLEQHQPQAAEQRFIRAKDIFLSIENKYQAGQAAMRIEDCRLQRQHLEPRSSNLSPQRFRTVVENDSYMTTQTDADPEDIGYENTAYRNRSPETETEIGETDSEKTEV